MDLQFLVVTVYPAFEKANEAFWLVFRWVFCLVVIASVASGARADSVGLDLYAKEEAVGTQTHWGDARSANELLQDKKFTRSEIFDLMRGRDVKFLDATRLNGDAFKLTSTIDHVKVLVDDATHIVVCWIFGIDSRYFGFMGGNPHER